MTDWVVIDGLTKEVKCLTCGERHAFGLPKLVTQFVDEVQSFERIHQYCGEPTPMKKKVK